MDNKSFPRPSPLFIKASDRLHVVLPSRRETPNFATVGGHVEPVKNPFSDETRQTLVRQLVEERSVCLYPDTPQS